MSSDAVKKSKGFNKEEGVEEIILIGKNVNTEIGRLLDGSAVTPFFVPGFHHHTNEETNYQWGFWPTFNSAMIGAGYSAYVDGVSIKEKSDQDLRFLHRQWLRKDIDEDRVAFLLRCKLESNGYIRHEIAKNNFQFIFVDENNQSIPRMSWLQNELESLRRYYRKSFAQGHQEPYVRRGRNRPFMWR